MALVTLAYLVKVILVEQRVPQMQFLEDHLVLGEGPGLIRQQVLDPTELLGYGGRTHHGAFDFLVSLNGPGVEHLSHVQVDS